MTDYQQRATTSVVARDDEQPGPAYPLYERVMRELADRDWTQTQLAEVSGVSRSTVDSWKTQPRPPRTSSIKAVADALRIDRTEAYRLAGIPEARIPRDEGSAPPAPSPSPALRDMVSVLREQAARDGRTLGELLVEYGLVLPGELVVPDSLPPDPIITQIEREDIPQDAKDRLIRIYLEHRAELFEQERLRRKEPDR